MPGTEKVGLLHKVVIPMVTSPLLGFVGGLIVMGLLYCLLHGWRPVTVNRVFGKLQLVSSAYMGFSHGMNDATKCMGIITLALVAATKDGLFDSLPGSSASSARPRAPIRFTSVSATSSWRCCRTSCNSATCPTRWMRRARASRTGSWSSAR